MVYIIKKNGSHEMFEEEKLIKAVEKSRHRTFETLTEDDYSDICTMVYAQICNKTHVHVKELHKIVENVLWEINPKVAQSYASYRSAKLLTEKAWEVLLSRENEMNRYGDRENANLDSTLVSTKRSLRGNYLSQELYKMMFLTPSEVEAHEDGYIHVHDIGARMDCINCCIFDMENVLRNGFVMGDIEYTEPNTLDVAFDVIGDIIMTTASQQYGGFTIPEIDKLLGKYAQKSHDKYVEKYTGLGLHQSVAHSQATLDVIRDFEQGFQGLELKLNTVVASRGDYPFVTFTFGLGTGLFERMATSICLETRMNGQGLDGKKKPVTFPKLVFLYDEYLHEEGKELHEQFQDALKCSSVAMYPDYLSLTGEGYVASIYKQYKKVISPMGCRAFLSPWYERGGMNPTDENDVPTFVGRFNIGAISLNLPMIYRKSTVEGKPLHEVLDYYLQMIREIHIRTYDYIGKMKASSNPVAFCQGGLYGGNLNPQDPIAPLLKSATASFGVTALHELQMLYNGKSIVEDGEFAVQIMKYINHRIDEFKKEDGNLYAIYGTPAESLCGTQLKKFRKKYGVIEGVSDREYFTNSFHCHVSEEITPVDKQDLESRFWNLFNGGKINYNRFPITYNGKAIESLVKHAMKLGLYYGVNANLVFCEDCGHSQLNKHVCGKCGSENVTVVDRNCGYLSYSRVHGKTRLNDAKLHEIAERKSM